MTISPRLDAYLETNDLNAVWFASPNSFSWLTGGSNVVNRRADIGVAAAGYDGNEVRVVTNNIEAQRLREEELTDVGSVETYNWFTSELDEAIKSISPTPAAADFNVEGFETINEEDLRQPLSAEQIRSYSNLSNNVAAIVEDIARQTRPDNTELDVAAELRRELENDGISAPVVLVGSATRAQQYRHCTPTDTKLGNYALISVTAERDGLHTSTTRTVAFDEPNWLIERTQKAMRVEATALAATQVVGRDGGTADKVFNAIKKAYEEVGWQGEWQNHHQGGAAGFAGREWIGTPDSNNRVIVPQGYAWNPTIKGAKSEDTFLVTEDKIEILSETNDWPTTEVEAVGYEQKLNRHSVLQL